MRGSLILGAVLASLCEYVQAKAVFAHFMVANTDQWVDADWQKNYNLAKESQIDGFALNLGYGHPLGETLLDAAFKNALATNFQVFLNFDYAAGGAWPATDVARLISKYRGTNAYFKYNNLPLVSTFEGYENAGDWPTIKSQAGGGIFFIPSWSSVEPGESQGRSGVDGLASWDAWPAGPNEMFSAKDSTYLRALGHNPEAKIRGRPYMMPVSPWFFARMPAYDKNWAWRGDSLWFDRWNQVLHKDPEFVQIISWNDFGESHYIGPLDSKQYAAFDNNHGKSPYNYAENFPHDGWRKHLPYLIDMYKNRKSVINNERVVTWYRLTSATNPACVNGGTTGNSAAKLQATYGPSQILQEKIFYSALLGSAATVTVTIGGVAVAAGWEQETLPEGGVGIYHGSASFTGRTGEVIVTIRRENPTRAVMTIVGQAIASTCQNGIQNYNAWVGSSNSGITVLNRATTPITNCMGGTGWYRYANLCAFTCRYDYCPDVCTCTVLGNKVKDLDGTATSQGCPNAGLDSTFAGLCSYSCHRNTCPSDVCTKTTTLANCNPPAPVKPAPYVCKVGKAYASSNQYFNKLCTFACKYNKCEPGICVCTYATPPPADTAPAVTTTQTYVGKTSENNYGLCNWACQRGGCDLDVCMTTAAAGTRRIASQTSVESTPARKIFPALPVSYVSLGKRNLQTTVHGHAARHQMLHGK